MSRFLFRSLILGLVIVFVCCVLSPFLLLYCYHGTEQAATPLSGITLRKALDIENEKSVNSRLDDLKFQIAELQRIKVSVRNEMRELEKKRNSIIQETESHKASYYKLQTGLHKGQKQLNVLQADLVNAGHKLYAATPPPNFNPTDPPPIFILSNNFPPPNQDTVQGNDVFQASRISNCESDISHCVDFSRCLLTGNLKFFLYNVQAYVPPTLKLKYPELLSDFVNHLQDSNSLVSDAAEACFFVVLLGPFEELSSSVQPVQFEDIIYNLKYWGRDGKNHVLVNLLEMSGSRNFLEEFDPLKAIMVQNQLTGYYRHNFDIVAPLVKDVLTPLLLWKQLPSILPAHRKYLLYFSGDLYNEEDIIGHVLTQLTKHLTEPVNIQLKCTKNSIKGKGLEIPLCDTDEERLLSLRQSTFAIVPMNGKTGYVRLYEALRTGAIPIVTNGLPLPFNSVVDWSEGAVIVPVGRMGEMHLIIRSISDSRILQLRRQGRFLFDTYFSSLSKVLTTVASILRSRLSHPPPPIKDVQGKSRQFGPDYKIASPVFQFNYSIYDYRFWNSPPGPTPMFPSTPWDPVPISGNAYSKMTDSQLRTLPPHVLQAGGITGPYFENYLLGDRPMEYFTIVMLTYKREEVVLESIESLDELKFLAKVIVVWNDLEKNPYDINWPKISVPLEIIWAEKNSLNNRFLPYDSIQTEAVLSIDDDVYLRHDEIQFAFRVWRESRDRLVGFPGRFHAFDVHNRKWLYNSNYTCELSMVLTGAAFYHKYYSYLYSYWQPQAILDLIDSKMNCEDIAMNFLISHITRKPPLKVTSRWTFHCPNCPDTLSQSDAHFNERHLCINTLTEIYGYTPLLYTQFRLDSVLFKTRLPSHLEKCYQYV